MREHAVRITVDIGTLRQSDPGAARGMPSTGRASSCEAVTIELDAALCQREDHRILNASRRRRVARGSGATVTEVNQLIKQYVEMRQMMQQLSRSGLFGGGGGLKGKLMRRAAGMMGMPDMSGMMGGGGGDDSGLPQLPPAPGAGAGARRKKKPRHKKRK